MKVRRIKRRARAGILTPKERRARKEYRRRNRVKLKKQAKVYYQKNKGRIKQRKRQNKKRNITGPKRKKNMKYRRIT